MNRSRRVIQWRDGRVIAVNGEWSGALDLQIALSAGGDCRALAYPALVGRPELGDLVLLNATALEAGLGTGGFAMVVAVPHRLPGDRRSDELRPVEPGHLIKARYTPLQAMVLGVDEQHSAHHALLADADDLSEMPVIVADLHSSLPAVLAGLRSEQPDVVVAYVMTDGGALPAWFSRTISGLRAAGWLHSCITAGQAFGGDLEAVSVHTGLLGARLVAGADVAIVIQGPGNLGTGTRWGFSGVAAGEAINAAAVLGGRPVAALRVSAADPRARHRGVSHHSLTAYGRVALACADVAMPIFAGAFGDQVRAQAAALAQPVGRHRVFEVPTEGLRQALQRSPVPLSTMGRGLDDDEPAFLAAAAAGRHAATLLR